MREFAPLSHLDPRRRGWSLWDSPSHGFASKMGCFPCVTDTRRFPSIDISSVHIDKDGMVNSICLTRAEHTRPGYLFFTEALNAIFSVAVSAVYFQGKSSCSDQPLQPPRYPLRKDTPTPGAEARPSPPSTHLGVNPQSGPAVMDCLLLVLSNYTLYDFP